MKTTHALAVAATLCLTLPAVAGPPLRINFSNASSAVISKLYVRISGSKEWGDNRVGKAGLAAGGRTQVMLADGVDKCVTDLTLTTKAGATFSRQVDFCHSADFTFHGN